MPARRPGVPYDWGGARRRMMFYRATASGSGYFARQAGPHICRRNQPSVTPMTTRPCLPPSRLAACYPSQGVPGICSGDLADVSPRICPGAPWAGQPPGSGAAQDPGIARFVRTSRGERRDRAAARAEAIAAARSAADAHTQSTHSACSAANRHSSLSACLNQAARRA